MRAPAWLVIAPLVVGTGCPTDSGSDADDGASTDGTTGSDPTSTEGGDGQDDGVDPTGGTTASVDDDDGNTTESPTTNAVDDTGTTDAGTDDTTGPGGCVNDDECSGSTPFCSAGECLPCTGLAAPDETCAAADPETPFCADFGCVQCLPDGSDACDGSTPVCQGETFDCVGCSYHDQCDVACNLETGSCMDDAPLFWARPDANNCGSNAPGTFGQPFCTPQQAIAAIDEAGDAGILFIEESDEDIEGINVPANTTVVVLPADGDRPVISDPIYVNAPGAQLFMEGVSITGQVFDVIDVTGGVVWLDRVDLYFNLGYAIDATDGAEIHLRNTVVGSNGRNSNLRGPIYLENSSLDAVYASIVANYQTNTSDSIDCAAGGSATIRNSIIIASDSDSIECDDITIDNSYIDTAGVDGSDNTVNVMVQDSLQNWFVDPGGVEGGGSITYGDDFHLTMAGEMEFGGIGVTQIGDLPVDFDGDPRPDQSGAEVMIGADAP